SKPWAAKRRVAASTIGALASVASLARGLTIGSAETYQKVSRAPTDGTKKAPWHVSPRSPFTDDAERASARNEFAGSIVLERLWQLGFGIHDEGTITRVRLADGLAGEQQHAPTFVGGCRDDIAFRQHGELPAIHLLPIGTELHR